MAVYERAYKGYAGGLTSARTRFLVIPRSAFRDVFQSRLFTAYFALCFAVPVIFAVIIYLTHNLDALKQLRINPADLIAVDAKFFLVFVSIQGFLAFMLSAIVGPPLITRDMTNNALPLYFSRPTGRAEYLAGKGLVLIALLSSITWMPGLLLFLLQSYLDGWGWFSGNLRIGGAILLAGLSWITVLSLMNLAAAALARRKMFARIIVLAIFFIGGGAGSLFADALGVDWGHLLNLSEVNGRIWTALFGLPSPVQVPLWSAWVSLAVLCLLCLAILSAKVRAYEVSR